MLRICSSLGEDEIKIIVMLLREHISHIEVSSVFFVPNKASNVFICLCIGVSDF